MSHGRSLHPCLPCASRRRTCGGGADRSVRARQQPGQRRDLADGIAAADIQTSRLSIWPNYPDNSQTPNGYSASESLAATLNSLAAAGTQIDAAVHAGGDATTLSGISLNLTDTSSLLAQARARAVADATAKASQYAQALGQPLGPVVSITDQAVAQPLPRVRGGEFRRGEGIRADLTGNPAAQRLRHRGLRGLTSA